MFIKNWTMLVLKDEGQMIKHREHVSVDHYYPLQLNYPYIVNVRKN